MVGIGGCVEALRLSATYEVPRQALTVGVPAKGLAQRVGGMLGWVVIWQALGRVNWVKDNLPKHATPGSMHIDS